MDFLNESWANMAEDADAEARLLASLEKEPVNCQHDNEGFQVQISKHQKKIQRKKQISRDSYATRSKGTNPKSFR